jgi:putative PIN family toxin of toxin-antitoxin system
LRVFLDTNVLVSAFATRGLCSDLLRLVLTSHELVLGEAVLEEVSRSLRGKLGVPDPIVHSIETLLRSFHIVPTPEGASRLATRDPSDDAILASALEAEAAVLITGDKDLLAVAKKVSDLRILDPRRFWQEISKRSDESAT